MKRINTLLILKGNYMFFHSSFFNLIIMINITVETTCTYKTDKYCCSSNNKEKINEALFV